MLYSFESYISCPICTYQRQFRKASTLSLVLINQSNNIHYHYRWRYNHHRGSSSSYSVKKSLKKKLSIWSPQGIWNHLWNINCNKNIPKLYIKNYEVGFGSDLSPTGPGAPAYKAKFKYSLPFYRAYSVEGLEGEGGYWWWLNVRWQHFDLFSIYWAFY